MALGGLVERVLFGIVLAYIVFNIWTFYGVFYPPECTDNAACILPMWTQGDKFTTELVFQSTATGIASDTLTLTPFGIDTEEKVNANINIPDDVFHNGTLKCKVTVRTSENMVVLSNDFLVANHRQPKPKAFNLMSSGERGGKPQQPTDPTTHWLSHLQISVLKDPVSFALADIPQELRPYLRVAETQTGYKYIPLFHINPQLQSTSDWTELPEQETGTLNFTVTIVPMSIGRLRLWCMLEQTTQNMKGFGFKEKDIEDIRGIFTDTNVYLLLTTIIVSTFHLFFDFLAFKNDIQFWRSAENTAGISIRTIIWRCVSSTIIFFYLREEKSSLLIVIPAGITMAIEFWKLLRMTKVSFSLRGGISMGQRNSQEQETDELDAHFMKRLMVLMVPLCIGGAVYSLLYMPHKSWRSWILQTAVNGVYAFGFLLMTPQLFINYRLKSVANLPWRALTYKAFNTFIDDFFAFIIKMPTAHRIACFRDDIIFVIYMYQRWLYPVDHTRVNEFGQRGEEHGGDEHKPDVCDSTSPSATSSKPTKGKKNKQKTS